MKFISKIHGEIEYNTEEIISFSKGIPGFEGLQKFVVKDIEDNEMFKVMHSLEKDDVAFILVSPFDVSGDYEIKIPEDVLRSLEIEKPEEVCLYNLVTLNSQVKNITANMKAPLVININSRKGEQVITNIEKYLIKHPLFKEV